MHSLNYHHRGEPKTWYTVPPAYKEKFEKEFKNSYPKLFEKNPKILQDIILQFSPAAAKAKGIPIYRTDQMPGEFILVFNKVFF